MRRIRYTFKKEKKSQTLYNFGKWPGNAKLSTRPESRFQTVTIKPIVYRIVSTLQRFTNRIRFDGTIEFTVDSRTIPFVRITFYCTAVELLLSSPIFTTVVNPRTRSPTSSPCYYNNAHPKKHGVTKHKKYPPVTLTNVHRRIIHTVQLIGRN